MLEYSWKFILQVLVFTSQNIDEINFPRAQGRAVHFLLFAFEVSNINNVAQLFRVKIASEKFKTPGY